MATEEARGGEGKTVHLCGVPKEHCASGLVQLSNSLKGKGLCGHPSAMEAFKCHGNYLVKTGWERLSSREYRPPRLPNGESGGPIRVLTKPCRFGAKMRPGKGTRSMPSNRTGGAIVG
jgi:hypothetical protein